MASTVTPEEIVTALGQTVLYPVDSEQFRVFAPFSLSPAVLELCQSGELTFAKLLTTSPNVLLPKA